jgi:hypothetical protein
MALNLQQFDVLGSSVELNNKGWMTNASLHFFQTESIFIIMRHAGSCHLLSLRLSLGPSSWGILPLAEPGSSRLRLAQCPR